MTIHRVNSSGWTDGTDAITTQQVSDMAANRCRMMDGVNGNKCAVAGSIVMGGTNLSISTLTSGSVNNVLLSGDHSIQPRVSSLVGGVNTGVDSQYDLYIKRDATSQGAILYNDAYGSLQQPYHGEIVHFLARLGSTIELYVSDVSDPMPALVQLTTLTDPSTPADDEYRFASFMYIYGLGWKQIAGVQ